MSLRTKLLIIFGVLSASIVLGAASTASRASYGALIAQVDERLFVISQDVAASGVDDASDLEILLGPSVARIDLAADGSVVSERPSGLPDRPDSLPVLPDDVQTRSGGPVTVDSRDSSLQYRLTTLPRGQGRVTVLAVSLAQIDTAMGQIGVALLIGGLLALIGGGALAAFFIRRETRKLDILASTADAFAVGDFATRAPVREDASEVGRVVLALNSMLDRVENSMLTEQEAKERLRVFIDDVSHELRTPVTTIQGYAELYEQGGLPKDDDVQRAMERIRNESGRMAILIEELLTLARMDMERVPRAEQVDVGRLIQGVTADAQVVADGRPVDCDVEQGLIIRGDAPRLQQAVLNLVTNALTHTPAGTPVHLRAWGDSTSVSVEVHDEAGAIGEDQLPMIFERTYRGARDAPVQGTGLGLSIVKRIVDEHGGVIESSSTPERGTRFRIILDRLPAAELYESSSVAEPGRHLLASALDAQRPPATR